MTLACSTPTPAPARPAGHQSTRRARAACGISLLLWSVATGLLPSTGMAQSASNAPIARGSPANNGIAGAKSGWAELTPAQQAALQPLAPAWGSISEAQKRKWIALSQNFRNLSPAERATLHGRMTEWANLSPLQRSQARLNFAQTNRLSTDEKKAQWQAYQALSPEQKQQLTAGGQVLPSGAAPALKPVAPDKLATVPVTRSDATKATRPAPPKPRAPATPRNARAASAPVALP